ncbi:MAG TPA: sigma-70 family RNA polymerase sigma factor [Rhizomicrobium sp.]|nr:sigma-70 family RNA polymerase sigma factor [Rhizomicrobium sp.]
MDAVDALVDDLFRRESGKMVSILVRLFGTDHLALAEDVVQDVLCRALEVWKFRGVPDNPSAWLMAAAKNRAIDAMRGAKKAKAYALNAPAEAPPDVEALFHPAAVRDEQLRMMYSCCHPKLNEDVQVALILNILCGFSAKEIAAAFLIGVAAVEKRLARGKKTLALSKHLLDLKSDDVVGRLLAVQRALYLLFNEGYHGANATAAVRGELCKEAIHLCGLLLEHPRARTGPTYGLAALMCLHAARLPARMDCSGRFVPMELQDRSKWDPELIARGFAYLDQSARSWELADYQIEAAIAAAHASAATAEDTDWETIVALYDSLLAVRPSAIVALNRAIAVGQKAGPERGLEEILSIADSEILESYPFYWATLGEFALRSGKHGEARHSFRKARELARNPFERDHYAARIAASNMRA